MNTYKENNNTKQIKKFTYMIFLSYFQILINLINLDL
jgi:hypothetical protein